MSTATANRRNNKDFYFLSFHVTPGHFNFFNYFTDNAYITTQIHRPSASSLRNDFPGCEYKTLANHIVAGGTALALQLGHHISLDFDFAQFGGTLPSFAIDKLITRLKQEGHQAQMITSPAQISQFKINHGLNLLERARDYVIDGVKVTFFVHGKNSSQEEFYRSAKKVREADMCFDILGIEGLKVARTLVLADLIRCRDLYDIYVLMRDHDYPLNTLFSRVKELGTVDDPEYYKATMRGEFPLDDDDEGLEAVKPDTNYEQIIEYFKHEIDEYETGLAYDHFRAETKP